MTKTTAKENQVLRYILSNLDKDEFIVHEIFSDALTDDEINGVVGSLVKKGVLKQEVQGIFKVAKL